MLKPENALSLNFLNVLPLFKEEIYHSEYSYYYHY